VSKPQPWPYKAEQKRVEALTLAREIRTYRPDADTFISRAERGQATAEDYAQAKVVVANIVALAADIQRVLTEAKQGLGS
jgi:hypothetical protein